MQYSGILVVALPGDVPAVSGRLQSLPGIAVYLDDAPSGRIVVVQEAPDIPAHEDGFRAIQATPGVLACELVYHHCDPAPGSAEDAGGTR
jgi:nitrate reductase NapAB chaperone NapD